MKRERDSLLARIETYLDLVPREAAMTEEVGPFTLFVPDEGTGWHFYARPRLRGSATFTSRAVEKVLARQAELGLPPAIEWVDEVTPSLLPAVRGAGYEPRRHPLLTLPRHLAVEPDSRARPLPSADPHLSIAFGTVKAGFRGRDEVERHDTGRKPELIEQGALIVVASYEGGRLCGAGSAAPRGDVAELMGIAVPPGHRNRGHGSAITRSLVAACRERGVDLVFLTASSDTAAGIYRRVGFTDTGTGYVLELDS
ncbi:GNAT family N-acetyltransferase [Intrasporangium sp.]|uniref:GNAT family N-acetyltransferase n=1 Tax=Intrasporangium sp. TaxID=1925024 RepID=UPI00293B57B2|nr:GNAT family N-acetyltransferase [Intrasporangium sp.]MDV3220954.1 GNAT family N-acetyltransferase [Intrasporangium sp.]